MKIKNYTPPTSFQIFEDWKHYIGACDINDKIITTEALMKWAGNPNRKFHCIFCGDEPAHQGDFMWCPRCKEYKGIVPDVYNLSE